jgi:F0F1-type ATP synthase assembly protein I
MTLAVSVACVVGLESGFLYVVRKVANLSHTQNKRNKRDLVFNEK